MRKEVQPTLVLALLLGTSLLVIAVALRFGWIHLGFASATSPVFVVAGAVIASIMALALVRAFSIVDRVRSAFPAPKPAADTITELADLAQTANTRGLLMLTTDARTHNHPLVSSGLHLLCEDADRKLIRAALESQAESQARSVSSSRSSIIGIGRTLQVLSALALLASLAVAALNAATPITLGRVAALSLICSLAAFTITAALVDPLISLLRRRSAAEEFAAAAAIEAVVAIQAREDAATIRSRLLTLMPTAAPRELPDQARRAA